MNLFKRDYGRMKREVDAYLRAVELEADSEAIYYKGLGVSGAATKIPRVIFMFGLIKRNQTVVNLFLPVVQWCYALLFVPFYFFFRAVNIALRLQAERSNCIEVQPRRELYLATSSGANLAFLPQNSPLPDFIITTPFRGVISANALSDVQRVPILGFANISDLVSAWSRAVLANWCLLRMNYGRNVLWGYTALDWYVIYIVLLRLQPKAIWVSNHHDRWLILALSIPDATVKMVQHGRLFHTLASGEEIYYTRKEKIKGVTSIYALDSRSEDLFSAFIDIHEVIYYRITASISLMSWRSKELRLLKILIIGGSTKIDFYLELMDEIRAALDQPVALAIRHHPLQKQRLSDLRFPIDYWELSCDEPVPAPDLVVSYGSSLEDQLLSVTQARLITYDWGDQIDIPEIIRRVQSVATDLEIA